MSVAQHAPAPESRAAAPLPGGVPLPARIGKYPIKAKLGEGSTSEVFLAWDEFRGHDVAIKRVRPGLVDSRDRHFQQRFFAAEAALVGRLHHPNVVEIFDAVVDGEGDERYLVMEVVAGATLRRFCRADHLLPVHQIVEIAFKCAMALGYCYRQGLIHRDVKPANILVKVDGEQITDLKLTDFGSAFDTAADHTQIYRVGSLAYMSPEQLDGDVLDCRADIYSLSAVMYHLLAGRPPFDAVHQQAIMQQIFTGRPPPLQRLRDGIPPALAELVMRGLSKRREDRPSSWEAFAQVLSALSAHHEVLRGPRQEVLDSERYTLLRSLPFFADFGDVELWEVVRRARWQRHPYGHALIRRGEAGQTFFIVTQGQVEVYRDGERAASLSAGCTVGEMAYLAPSPDLRVHSVDVLVSQQATTLSFTPETMGLLSLPTRALFDKAFIAVLVRRLHAAHEQLAHPRRIL